MTWMVLHTRSDITKDIEILVLRHQLAVLQRRTPRQQITWTDRALIAACGVPKSASSCDLAICVQPRAVVKGKLNTFRRWLV
jgi:hypothetical protein